MTHALGLAAATFVLRGFINGRKVKKPKTPTVMFVAGEKLLLYIIRLLLHAASAGV